MQKPRLLLHSSRAALQVHQAGHVRRHDKSCAALRHKADLVVSHLGGYRFLRHGERPAKPAALIDSLEVSELDSPDALKKRLGFRELRILHPLTHRSHFQPPDGRTACVQRDLVLETRPGKFADLEYVVQELYKVI